MSLFAQRSELRRDGEVRTEGLAEGDETETRPRGQRQIHSMITVVPIGWNKLSLMIS